MGCAPFTLFLDRENEKVSPDQSEQALNNASKCIVVCFYFMRDIGVLFLFEFSILPGPQCCCSHSADCPPPIWLPGALVVGAQTQVASEPVTSNRLDDTISSALRKCFSAAMQASSMAAVLVC